MSKKVELLLDEPCPELLCGICSDVLEDPMQLHCPEDHMFCSKCIHHHVDNSSKSCPLCFTTLNKNSFQLSKFVQRQVGRLRIKCLYWNNECPWQGLISDNHIAECDYKPVICPNAENGCTVNNLTNRNMDQHISECLYQYIHCPNNMPMCQPVLRKDLSIHENDCSSYACPFATEGCPYIGTLNSMIIHRDGYCGRLHKKIQDLEEECKRLNTLIHDVTIGLNIKLPSTPATAAPIAQDTSMDNEMALFHQMFNSDPFGSLDLNNDGKDNTPVGTPMDLLSATTDMSFLDNNTTSLAIFSTENNPTSPQPLQFIPPMTVPKRTSNGKKIRYSKNVRLAHSAIRIARQRTASSNTNVSLLSMNPSNDAILNNLDIAKQKLQQQQQTITFKNLDDVTQFLNNEDSNSNMSRSLSSSTVTQQKKKEKEKKRNNSITSVSSTNAVKSPMQIAQAESPRESISSPSSSSNAPPKRRPMFILASSYLSNYNSANSPTNNNDE